MRGVGRSALQALENDAVYIVWQFFEPVIQLSVDFIIIILFLNLCIRLGQVVGLKIKKKTYLLNTWFDFSIIVIKYGSVRFGRTK